MLPLNKRIIISGIHNTKTYEAACKLMAKQVMCTYWHINRFETYLCFLIKHEHFLSFLSKHCLFSFSELRWIVCLTMQRLQITTLTGWQGEQDMEEQKYIKRKN